MASSLDSRGEGLLYQVKAPLQSAGSTAATDPPPIGPPAPQVAQLFCHGDAPMADAALEADSPGGLVDHAVAGAAAARSSGSIRWRRSSRLTTITTSARANNPVPA
jgi:hypothetical protein